MYTFYSILFSFIVLLAAEFGFSKPGYRLILTCTKNPIISVILVNELNKIFWKDTKLVPFTFLSCFSLILCLNVTKLRRTSGSRDNKSAAAQINSPNTVHFSNTEAVK